MKRIHIFLFTLPLIFSTACNKYVDTPLPKNELVSDLVFTDDKAATSAVTGVYGAMYSYNYQFANILMNYLTAMQADDMYYYTSFANYDVFRENRLLPSSQYVQSMFANLYSFIYQMNACVAGLSDAKTLTPSVRSQLLGESYFMRSFFYFYLVNLYGDVPLITGTDYKENGVKPREKTAVVYDTIISNLKSAVQLMGDDYPTGQRLRPNKAAANALLARVYLYTKQWALAASTASLVINDSRYSLLADLNKVFLANSEEAIFQLEPINITGGRNTWEGLTSTPASATATAYIRLDTLHLIAKYEANDQRLAQWTGFRKTAAGATYYFPYKYKVRTDPSGQITEYSMVMRLAEQYFIRAEARIQQSDLDGGRADLNAIRERAGLQDLPATLSKDALLLAVEQERHVELFAEWGHRWFDLKRTGRSDAVLGPIKGANWQATDTLYPIPANAISTNINLTQNEGYN
ncbi:RagB/SusD domain-containing protein [Chitinophaga costaii]|uniref:RagB/SusD domain-containing protein n=1 Tax=Chitinophaga costaii TaxID=1335309 RepID=A0A1C3ZMB5_9BACT|nr:RagB/SusD family nutrient uptake outer membrane protein [Chitinophaga costaii]PUZ30431.1 RagB/SusD family nutrient uptake outer membrane protein [Chitinophaga costaii]SCB83445.1 RagB/SusD domain-containing protein [Chitinophaga costaii]